MKIDRIHVFDPAIKRLKQSFAINAHRKFSTRSINAFSRILILETQILRLETRIFRLQTRTLRLETHSLRLETRIFRLQTQTLRLETRIFRLQTQTIGLETRDSNFRNPHAITSLHISVMELWKSVI